MSDSEGARGSPSKGDENDDDEEEDRSNARKRRRLSRGKATSVGRRASFSAGEEEELAEELEELTQGRRKRRAALMANEPLLRDRRPRKQVDYRVYKPDLLQPPEDDQEPAPSPSRRARGGGAGGWQRSLFPTFGPFGGAGGPPPMFGGPGAIGAAGGVDSDSSDDERVQRSNHFNVGMTPTAGAPPGLLPPAPAHGADPLQAGGLAGTPANLGKMKDRQALADADPLGVDQNVTFDSVGGLGDHINQLQEMVALPLLYPEVFSRFHVTPPRGVLFHGPPGTGKTLLARALATSVSSQGRKVTFYMRKGADALSKWVGEAERQLRLLFEEARKNQPSIIFFDEIDGW
jgi:SpoVK/Ycf46/Vps4 family AAA+-type ATPase